MMNFLILRSSRLAAFVLAAAAILSQNPPAKGGTFDVEAAKKKLAAPDEATVRSGAKSCLDANSAESAELLVKLMSGAQPHMRDIAFEFLEKFTNPYALAVVENHCQSDKDDNVRAWCADLLGAYGGKSRVDPLYRALQESNDHIKASAARALGRLKSKEASWRLATLKNHPNALVRAHAIAAWAKCDPKNNGKGLALSLNDRDAGVRAAVLATIAEVAPSESLERSRAKLADGDWRVRLQAVQNLQQIRERGALEGLVIATGDGRRAIAAFAEKALLSITGKKFFGNNSWKQWWEGEGKDFQFPAGAGGSASKPASRPEGGGETGVFFGLPIDSDHVAFLIDCGATMSNLAPGGACTKMEQVLAELETTLKSLPSGTRFNIFAYAPESAAWQKKAQLLNEKSLGGSLMFLKGQPLAGRKNIWAALLAALDDPDIDTFYLMSDGEPEDGLYVHYNRVVDHLKRINVLRKVVVHTVHVADPSWSAGVTEWYRSQLREIAKATGGNYVEK